MRLVFLVIFLFLFTFTHGQPRLKLVEKIPRNTGGKISISENFMAIGIGDFEDKTVHVLQKVEGHWVEKQIIHDPNEKPRNDFGYSVSLSGKALAIGDLGYGSCGSVYIYRFIDEVWQLEATLEIDECSSNAQFGNAVSLFGNTLIVGSRYNDESIGSAFIYEKTESGWKQIVKLEPLEKENECNFGESVLVKDNLIFVGAPNCSGSENGSVYIYRKVKGEWLLENQILGDQVASSFGYSLGFAEGNLVVGSIGDGAFIFKEGYNRSWQIQRAVRVNNAAFGLSVGISNRFCAVGAWRSFNKRGSVYVYANIKRNWVLLEKLLADPLDLETHFGADLFLEDNVLVVAADAENALYIYELIN